MLAGAVSSPDISRRAWHLALAATGPDESAAIELDAAATYALECGDALAAGRLLARAAGPRQESSRADRLVRAGMAFSRAGSIPEALDVLDQALVATPDPLLRADIELLRAIPYLFAYGPAQTPRILVDLGTQLLDLDAGRSAMAGVLAALVSFSCSRMNEVRALCQRALDSGWVRRSDTRSCAVALRFRTGIGRRSDDFPGSLAGAHALHLRCAGSGRDVVCGLPGGNLDVDRRLVDVIASDIHTDSSVSVMR